MSDIRVEGGCNAKRFDSTGQRFDRIGVNPSVPQLPWNEPTVCSERIVSQIATGKRLDGVPKCFCVFFLLRKRVNDAFFVVHDPTIGSPHINVCHRLNENPYDRSRFVSRQASQRPTSGVDVQDTDRVKYIGLVWVVPVYGKERLFFHPSIS